MASFWSKLQIPGFSSTKVSAQENQSLLLRSPSLLKTVVKESVRYFWFRKSQEAVEYGTGNCGKPPVQRLEPCKGCPSKCLETGYGKPVKKSKRKGLGSRKEPAEIKQKPSNCEEAKPPEKEKLSWWEQIFGPDPKRSWPDPCTCRLAYRRRKKLRAMDPRLNDDRYKETAGDVYIYTIPVKPCSRACFEPQPKPPPSFKVPKAVLYKMMDSSEKPFEGIAAEINEKCKSSPHLPTPYRIPYEEMRPVEKRRRVFTCREGIRSEDVLKPISRGSNPRSVPPTAQMVDAKDSKNETNDRPMPEQKSNSESWVGRRSRVEQLKNLVQKKSTFECISSSAS